MAEDANKLVRDGIGGGGIEGNREQAYRTADGMAAGLAYGDWWVPRRK